MQSGVLVGAAPYALPLKHKILPQFLNNLGYKSIAVGKWHLGKKDIFYRYVACLHSCKYVLLEANHS